MSNRTIRVVKVVVFLACLVPLCVLLQRLFAQDLGADPIRTITHNTGSTALIFLLLSLAVTPLRRVSPHLTWLIRFRRMLGLYAFFYATLHLLIYIVFSGYDVSGAIDALRTGQFHVLKDDWVAIWPTMMEDMRKRKFIQVGLVAYSILLVLAATSPQWVLRKMGGKPWQWLHRTVYLCGFLALMHYWWLVKPGDRSPAGFSIAFFALMLARPLTKWLQSYLAGRRKVAVAS